MNFFIQNIKKLKKGTDILATTSVPSTGGWQNWQTITTDIKLTAGKQTLRVYANGGDFNLNWINFIATGDAADVNNDNIIDIFDLVIVSKSMK